MVKHTGRYIVSREYYNSRRDGMIISSINRFALGRKEPIRILDVGCNDADFLFKLAKKKQSGTDFILEGLDLVEDLIEDVEEQNKALGRPVSHIWHMDVEKEAPRVDYDIILMREIVEHLHKPEASIKRLAKQLKKNGLLLITSVNTHGMLRQIAKVIDRLSGSRLRNLYWSGSIAGKPPPISSMDGFSTRQIHGHISSNSADYWRKNIELAGCILRRRIPTMLVPGSAFLDRHPIIFRILRVLDDISIRSSWGIRMGTGFMMECIKT
ncbi:MAG: class I SAM-dependent methyltransferase [Planctomycetota bacterium]|jgi:SAM-dependent methyltransferase